MVELSGIRFASVTEPECVEIIASRAAAGQGGWLVTPNVDILRRCAADPAIADLVRSADLVVADGQPLIWASRLQRTPLPARVPGSDLVLSLAAASAERGLSIFLLGGGRPQTAAATAEVLKSRHPKLKIAGTFYPEFGFEDDEEQVQAIADRIAETRPDLVFVALGFPKAERLIQRLREVRPEAWWAGIGISFSFLTGEVRRAPVWVQNLGFEWFHRLLQEPRRLARRYLVHGIPFALRLLSSAAWRRWFPG